MEVPLFILEFEQTPKRLRQHLFMEETQHFLSEEYNAWFDQYKPHDEFHYTKFIAEHNEYGTVEYFPNGDRVHIHKFGSSGWHDKGLRWIAENFEKEL